MGRQFVAVRFKPWDRRTYTYHWDGEPFAPGDQVVVTTDRGPSTVEVISVSGLPPPFPTKPIVGRERPLPAASTEPLEI